MEASVTVLLTVMVGLFGLTSAVLGFIAEAQKLAPKDIRVSGYECVYPANDPAHTLGVWAILLLAVAQITALAAGGCCGCCCRRGGSASKSKRRVVGVVVSVLSWIMAIIAVWHYWLAVTVTGNTSGTRRATFAGNYEECFYLKSGVFTKAAVLSLVATVLAIKSCFLLRAPAATPEALEGAEEAKAAEASQNPPEAGVAVGLPQSPAQGHGPHPAQG